MYALDEKVEAVNKDPVGRGKGIYKNDIPAHVKIRCSLENFR